MISFQCFFLSKYASTPVTTFVYLQNVSRGYNPSVTDVPAQAQHYQQLASHSFFSDEVGDCARSHDVVMCDSHSIEPGTCDNYGGPGAAIYCKAQKIRWKYPCKFQNVALRMGAFHTATAFLAVLGKPFGDAGLQDDSLKNTLLLLLLLLLLEYNNDTQIEKTSTNPVLHKSSSQIFTNSQIFFFF